ncbi:hypothetical protein VIBRN418_07888 [Vibrio sp. N418]|uniref:hypothetical protein n=1 Tax=Vibrio sp. (strain N418) TaxID=701176 RepID=UPI00021BF9FE|nr:hypothetical protein [Vibrio sp. N418]EGU37398.1 hypothetical protein VIBRN418_07888 [Vibrio sp. N418]
MGNELEYYLSLESDLEVCSKYVEFSEDNFRTYSVQFTKIIMAASAEIDTLAKEMCKIIDPSLDPKSIRGIGKYAELILGKYPKLVNIEMSVPRYGLSFKPWGNWSKTESPSWWQGNNALKHDRVNNFQKANLENAIESLAALLALTLYYHIEKNGKPLEINAFFSPRLLSVVEENNDWTSGGITHSFNLP